MKQAIKLIMVLALAIGLTGIAVAKPYGQNRGPGANNGECREPDGPEPRLTRLAQQLNLSETQAEQFRVINESSREALRPLHEQSRVTRERIRDMVESETLDMEALRQMVHQEAETKMALIQKRHETRQKVNELLTAEQQEELAKIRTRKAAERFHRRQHRAALHDRIF